MGQGSNLSGSLSCMLPQYDVELGRAHYSLLSNIEYVTLPPTKFGDVIRNLLISLLYTDNTAPMC